MRLHEVISAAMVQRERTPDEPVMVAATIEDGAIQPRTRCVIVVVGETAAAALTGAEAGARTQRWQFTTPGAAPQTVAWVYSTEMHRIGRAISAAERREVHFRWIDRKRDTRRPVMCVDLPPITMLRPRSAAPDLPAEEGQGQP